MPDGSGKHQLRFNEAHPLLNEDTVVPEMTVQRLDHAAVLGLSLPYCLKRYSERAAPIPECCRGSPCRQRLCLRLQLFL